MKKLTIMLSACLISVPLFAFNFNDGTFEIDSKIKTQLTAIITGNAINIVKENQQSVNYTESEILSVITEQLKLTQKNVERNSKMRNKFPNRKFIQEQKLQKQRYENIFMWNIPQKIVEYIKANFDLQRVKDVSAFCKHVNETGIDVYFSYDNNKSVIVSYTYTESPDKLLITHTVSE